MSQPVRVVLTILLLATAGVLGWSSYQAHRGNQAFLAGARGEPGAKLLDAEIGWGLARSGAELRFELPSSSGAVEAWVRSRGAEGPLVVLALRNELHYGPLPLLEWLMDGAEGSPVVARMHTTMELEGAAGEALREAVGPLPPVVMRTRVRASEVGEAALHMEPRRFEVAREDGDVVVHWKGLTGQVVFEGNLVKVAGSLRSAGLDVQVGEAQIGVSQLDWSGDYSDAADPLPTGTTAIRVGEVRVAMGDGPPLLAARGFSMHQESRMEGGAFAIDLLHRIEELSFAGQSFGPGVLDLRLRGLDPDSLGTVRSAAAEIEALEEDDPAGQEAVASRVVESLPALLASGPSLELHELSLETPQGALDVSMSVRVDASQPELLQSPLTALVALEADADAALPARFVHGFVEGWVKRRMQAEAAQSGRVPGGSLGAARDELLRELRKSGFLLFDGSRYTTRASFRGGQLTVNGLPVQAGPFGGGAVADAMPLPGDAPRGPSLPFPGTGQPPASPDR